MISFAISIAVGRYGPDVFITREAQSKLRINRTTQSAKWTGVMQPLSPENQLLWMTASITRPLSIPESEEFTYTQPLKATIYGATVPIVVHEVRNSSLDHEIVHDQETSRKVTFPPNSPVSLPVNVFNFHSISYPTYKVVLEFESVPDPFVVDAEGEDTDLMTATFDVIFVNPEYTNFEICWK